MTKPTTMTIAEFRDTLTSLGWTYRAAARQLGISSSSIAKYAAGAHIPAPVAALLRVRLSQLRKPASFTLAINTENAAFDENPAFEIARILREAAARVEEHHNSVSDFSGRLRDMYGNNVGAFSYSA